MHKLTFVLVLVALLAISTAVVYAGVEWDSDPPIGQGFHLAFSVKAGSDPGWNWDKKVVRYHAKIKTDHDGEIKVEAEASTRRYHGQGNCTLSVTLTREVGRNGMQTLDHNWGPCGEKVKVKWESDDD